PFFRPAHGKLLAPQFLLDIVAEVETDTISATVDNPLFHKASRLDRLTLSGERRRHPACSTPLTPKEFCVISPVLPTYKRADIAFARGDGPYLFTEDGERYLDFGAGIAVNALGHAHPHLVAALRAQADKLWHTSNLYHIPEGERLAARLTDATFADTVFFAN